MRTFRRLIALWCVAVVALGNAHAALANVIIAVNTSTPSAVTFTATGNPASTGFFSSNSSSGVFLQNFLTADFTIFFGSVTGNLTPSGALSSYDRMALYSGIPTLERTIGLYNILGEQQSFLTVLPALRGSATGNLSTYSALFPSAGAMGDVTARTLGVPTVIGQWQVVPVPLPASALLFATALAGLVGAKRLRASAA